MMLGLIAISTSELTRPEARPQQAPSVVNRFQ
jgi:hypothetical protein